MKKKLFLILLILLTINSYPFRLKKLFTIGREDNEKYIFFSIGSITVDEEENIYVFDQKGYVLRKYDNKGKFLCETGKKGKGPGDFSFSSSLSYWNGKIYVFDQGNKRIGVYDKNLKLIKYIVSRELPDLLVKGFFIYKNKIYTASRFLENKGRIGVFNFKGKIEKTFFEKIPDYIESEFRGKDKKRSFLGFVFSSPFFVLNREREEIAVMFFYPEEKMKVFLYDLNGNMIDVHEINILKGYKVPENIRRLEVKITDDKKYQMGSIGYTGNYLFCSYFEFSGKKRRGTPYFAVYDVKKRKIVFNKKNLFYIIYHGENNKLYVSDEENEKVIVLEIEE